MLGINTIKSGIRENEEYYTQDESLARSGEEYSAEETQNDHSRQQKLNLTRAIFYGKGTVELKLEGTVTQEQFKSLFYGYKPGTQERIRGRKQNQHHQERLAEDITFSPPKSFSVALHVGKDYRLFEAHTEAVKEVIDIIERDYIQTRIRDGEDRQIVNTGNLIAALIPHHTSRDGDMQIHTHVVVFNGTECADGKYRALSTNAIASQQWLGHLYQSLLAQKVQKLGYKICPTKDGFELSGISRKQIEVFSKRSRSIINSLQQQNKEINHKNRDRATLTTRRAKNTVQTLEEYQQQWQTEALNCGITAPVPQSKPVVPAQKQTAKEALDSAIAHYSEHSVSFSQDKIYEYIYQSGLQSFSASDLEREIKTHKSLISLENKQFTTVEALKREIDTARQWLKGQRLATPLLALPEIEATKLNSGQAEAIRRTLTSTDRHQIIHGLSGVGKTTALGILRNQLRGTGVEIKGFAPTIEAAKELQKELNIKTNTVAHLALANPEDKPNQLWIIDEAGLMSASAARSILDKAESVNARILLVGDKGQNSSVEAGSPLRSLMKHGATTHSISQIIRQQNSVQKQAVELIAHGQGSEALELLNDKGYINEIEDDEVRSTEVAQQYLELSPKERQQTLIVTGTNKERRAITHKIRVGLQERGEIGQSIKAVGLVSRNLSKEQSKFTSNYRVGDYIKLFHDYKTTPLQKGQLYKVEKISSKGLSVSSYGGRNYTFDPSRFKDKQVFTSRQIEFAVGDQLRWSSGADKTKGQINGKQVKVKAIDSLSIKLEDNQGKIQSVSLLQPLPLDHDLVSTSYRAQGKSKKRVIVSATNDPTSSLEPFYVKISRQIKDLKVYTQDLERLRNWVKRSNTQQNPLELIEQTHERRQAYRNTLTTPTTESADNRKARQPTTTDHRERREYDTNNSIGIEPVHSGIDRSIKKQERGQSRRTTTTTGAIDSIPRNEGGRDDRAILGGGIELEKLDGLADAIATTQVEEELIEILSDVRAILDKVESAIELHKLEALSKTIDKVQSQKFEFQGIEQLASTIHHHNDRSTLTSHLKELIPNTEQLKNRVKQLQSKSSETKLELEGINELSNQITANNIQEEIFSCLNQVTQNTEQLRQQVQNHLDRIAHSLADKKIDASRNERLDKLIDSFKTQRDKGAFWQPIYDDAYRPLHLEQQDWEEFKQSVIHPDLMALNAVSLEGYTPHEYLLYNLPNSDRLNTGRLRNNMLQRYAHLEDGGWWGSAGIDASSLEKIKPGEKPETSPWGCFKPYNPRIAADGKAIKYESPPKTDRAIFLPEVSEELADKIYQKHGINPTSAERESGFWYVVKKYDQIPITITEGFKKTLSSLSQGEVTIGLMGVNHIYRSTDKDKNKLLKRELNPEVAIFATEGREFRMAYDQDTKVKSIVNVRRDMVRGIELLEERSCQVKVLKWDSARGKGLDDLIANNGAAAYANVHKNAISSSLDKLTHYRTEYNKLAKQVHRELGDDISVERLDLEIYIRSVLKGEKADGARVIGESDRSRFLKKKNPRFKDAYLYGIEKTAGIYLNMSRSKISDLGNVAKKIVTQQMAQHQINSCCDRPLQQTLNQNLGVEREWER